MPPKKPVPRKAAKQDSGQGILFWSIALLILIVSSIGTYYYISEKKKSEGPKAEFVKVGKVQAHLAGKRLVQTEINLEVKDATIGTVLQQRKPEVRATIEASFAQASEQTIHTVEGKIAVQQDIRRNLNKMLGKKEVKEVLFSNFTLE